MDAGAAKNDDGVLDAVRSLGQIWFKQFEPKTDAAGFTAQEKLGVGEGQAARVGIDG